MSRLATGLWRPRARVVALVAVVALATASCGGDADPQPQAGPQGQETVDAEAAAAEQSGDVEGDDVEGGEATDPDAGDNTPASTPDEASTPEGDANNGSDDPAPQASGDEGQPAASDDTIAPPEIEQRTISFTTADDETLSGTIFGDGDKGIVLAHMRGRDSQTWFEFGQRAAAEGYRVLAFDFRGYGASTGTVDTNLDTDLAAAVGALRSDGAASVMVMGASMGGTAAVNIGTQLDLAGVVALSAPANFLGLEALEVAVNVTEPLLAIAGDLDQPYADAVVGIGDRASNGQSILLESSQHGTNLFVSHDTELTNLLLAFARDNFG